MGARDGEGFPAAGLRDSWLLTLQLSMLISKISPSPAPSQFLWVTGKLHVGDSAVQMANSRVGRDLKFMSLGKQRGNCLLNTSESSGAGSQGQCAVVADVHGKMLPALPPPPVGQWYVHTTCMLPALPHLMLYSGMCTLLACSSVQAVSFTL